MFTKKSSQKFAKKLLKIFLVPKNKSQKSLKITKANRTLVRFNLTKYEYRIVDIFCYTIKKVRILGKFWYFDQFVKEKKENEL